MPVGLVGVGRFRAKRDEDSVKIAVLLLLLSGCAVISDRRTVAGCQVADGVTTYAAMKKGAVELNGILAGLTGTQILMLKLLIAYVVYTALPENPADGDRFAMTLASGMGCIPAANNISVIWGLP